MDANGPTGDAWPPAAEGVLIAHRRVLELLLSTLALARGDGLAMIDDLERRLSWRDPSEDPGAEPDRAFAIERVADEEVRRLLRQVRATVAAKTEP